MRVVRGLILCGLLAGCSTGIPLQKYNNHSATPESFMLCHGYSCTHKSKAGFTDPEWAKIAAIFKNPAAKDAQVERSKIGRAIALMEQYSGAKTGTDDDDAEAVGIKRNTNQLDCIDETVNTTMYVGLLQKANLLQFHEVAEPTHRGYIVDGSWPHNTAVIREIGNNSFWVVDSFYRKNGEEPHIMERKVWLDGWKPAGSKQ